MKFIFLLYCVTLFWKLIKCTNTTVNEKCSEGDYNPELRIVGGETVSFRRYPYMAQISALDVRVCGASVISRNWILTAAHCTCRHEPDELGIRVETSVNAKSGYIFRVSEKIEHPNYDDTNLDYDIAVLRLSRHIPRYLVTKPVSLPDVYEFPEPGSSAIVTGWGLMEETGIKEPVFLRAVDVTVISLSQCRDWYRNEKINDWVICAGHEEGMKDACVSDSGGPLVFENEQIGIVSWGIGCARPKQPGVYTSVAHPEIRYFIKKASGL